MRFCNRHIKAYLYSDVLHDALILKKIIQKCQSNGTILLKNMGHLPQFDDIVSCFFLFTKTDIFQY